MAVLIADDEVGLPCLVGAGTYSIGVFAESEHVHTVLIGRTYVGPSCGEFIFGDGGEFSYFTVLIEIFYNTAVGRSVVERSVVVAVVHVGKRH